MINLFIELSKYIIDIFIVIYAILSIVIFALKNPVAKSVFSGLQNTMNIFIAGIAMLHLFLFTRNNMYLAIGGFVVISLFLLLLLTTLIYKEADRILLNNMSMLFTTGLIIISRISVNKAIKQYIIFMICFAICMILPFIFSKLTKLKELKWLYCILGITMISIVMLLGEVTHGSKLFFSFFGISFQPSEVVKILFVLFVAASLFENTSFKNIALTSLLAAIHVIILVISKDLGTALVFFITYLFMLLISTANYLYLFGGGVFLVLASLLSMKIFSHVRTRVIVWRDPWTLIDSKGYQITQGLFAITTGGAFGTGLGKGSPNDIPYVETDFIFSAITEELGLIYSICLLVICISSMIEMIRISEKINDRFYSLIIYGISISLTFQVFLTVGGSTKFIPLTGVTLPLVSYGGTSFMVTMFMYFIVQSIYIRLRKADNQTLEKPIKFHKKGAINEKE